MSQIYNFKINYEQVLARMGANKFKTRIDEKTESAIKETLDNAQKLLQPRYAMAYADKVISDGKINADGLIIESSDIMKLLNNSQKLCGFVATIGNALDQKIELLQKNDKTTAFIYDAAGSVAIEQLVTAVNNEIKKSNPGFILTKRFSVGYGDWKIENQKVFLRWLGAEKIGITLSETFQMSPRKSVSAIVGLEKYKS